MNNMLETFSSYHGFLITLKLLISVLALSVMWIGQVDYSGYGKSSSINISELKEK
jgi:hypothetical protein